MKLEDVKFIRQTEDAEKVNELLGDDYRILKIFHQQDGDQSHPVYILGKTK